MSKYKSRALNGFVDPMSIIGGLFLVVTLFVGTYVVTNKKISLNINEQAGSCMTTCMREVGDTDECSYSCGVSKPAEQITAKTPKPEPEKIDNNLEAEEVGNIQEVITAPVVINGSVVSPVNESQNQNNNQQNQQNTQQQAPIPTSAPTNTCNANGTSYPENSVIEYGSGTYRKCVGGVLINNCGGTGGAIELCEITDLTVVPTHLQTQYNQATQQQTTVPTENYVAGPAMQTPRPGSNTQTQANTTTLVNNNSTVSTNSSCNDGCPTGQSCVSIGYGYFGCQNTESITAATPNAFSDMTGGSGVINPCPAGSTWIDNTCVSNQVMQQNQTANTAVENFINNFSSNWSDAFGEGTMFDNYGTMGLGGGNANVAPIPQSVITSTDPNAFSSYSQGSKYSFGAGVITTGTILTGSSLPAIGQSILSNSVVQSILPYYALADIADTTIATIQCGVSGNASSPECSAAVASLVAPPGVGFADDMSDTMQILSKTNQVTDDLYAKSKAFNYYSQKFGDLPNQIYVPEVDQDIIKWQEKYAQVALSDNTNKIDQYRYLSEELQQQTFGPLGTKIDIKYMEFDPSNPCGGSCNLDELNNVVNITVVNHGSGFIDQSVTGANTVHELSHASKWVNFGGDGIYTPEFRWGDEFVAQKAHNNIALDLLDMFPSFEDSSAFMNYLNNGSQLIQEIAGDASQIKIPIPGY